MKKTVLIASFALLGFIGFSFVVKAQSQSGPGTHPMIANSKTAQVSIESGPVAGYLHQNVFNFKGIPYAQAERFMPPQKPASWTSVRSCRAYGPVCPINVASMILFDEMEFAQQHNFGYMNEEKCLNLNVWTLGLNDGKKRPVMVWLHGGGYSAGSSCELPSYDGENLSRTGDVVIVSINHRLNVLGYLDLTALGGKYEESVNLGMKDIVMALQWVNDNIAKFGGDPGNVTIFGQSGGAGKVGTLMYAPSAKGLFHKAIMQSGGKPGFTDPELSRQVGLAMLEELGIKKEESDKLKTIPYDVLLAAGNKAIAAVQTKTGKRMGLGWGPVLDGKFLPKAPGDEDAEALAKDVPLLIGTTKTEFGMSARNPEVFKGSREVVRKELEKKYGDKTDAYIAAYDKAYPKTNMQSDMIDVDFLFRPGTLVFANLKSQLRGGARVYNYIFTWDSPVLDGMLKSAHCMELAFVFNNIARTEQYNGGTPEAYALAEKMAKTWVSFARTGDPNNNVIPKWEPYTEAGGAVLLFDNKIELKHNHDKELLQVADAMKNSLF